MRSITPTRAPRGLRGALASGDTGHDVRVLQQDLVDRGYLATDEVTGTYDYGTEQAVMALQGYNDLNKGGMRDGIASPSSARWRPAATGRSRSTAARRTSRSASASRR